MNIKTIIPISILAIINSILPLPSHAQSQNIYNCLEFKNNPTTVVDTQRGRIQLIIWNSNFFRASGWTPQRRCEAVTQRFQKFSDSGSLRYIATGRMNRLPVICVAEKKPSGFKCKSDGLLITLQPSDNPNNVLIDLFDISSRISSGGLSRGGILDLEEFLENVPTIPDETQPSSTTDMSNDTTSIPPEKSPCPPLLCPDDNNNP